MKKPEDYGSIMGLNEEQYNALIEKIKLIQLDTMKDIEFQMCVLSDMTTKTQGYRNLVNKIKALEDKL